MFARTATLRLIMTTSVSACIANRFAKSVSIRNDVFVGIVRCCSFPGQCIDLMDEHMMSHIAMSHSPYEARKRMEIGGWGKE